MLITANVAGESKLATVAYPASGSFGSAGAVDEGGSSAAVDEIQGPGEVANDEDLEALMASMFVMVRYFFAMLRKQQEMDAEVEKAHANNEYDVAMAHVRLDDHAADKELEGAQESSDSSKWQAWGSVITFAVSLLGAAAGSRSMGIGAAVGMGLQSAQGLTQVFAQTGGNWISAHHEKERSKDDHEAKSARTDSDMMKKLLDTAKRSGDKIEQQGKTYQDSLKGDAQQLSRKLLDNVMNAV